MQCYPTCFHFSASTNQTQSLDLAHALLQTKAADSEEQTDVSTLHLIFVPYEAWAAYLICSAIAETG